MKIATHNGLFHADDVLAVAILREVARLADDEIGVVRTRDQRVVAEADVAVDVGGEYVPERGRFDHHQRGGAGVRDNGIPYAAAGLVWRHYGPRLVAAELGRQLGRAPTDEEAAAVAAEVDCLLIQPVDAVDCGVELAEGWKFADIRPLTLSHLVSQRNPRWDEDASPAAIDGRFHEAVEQLALPALRATLGEAVARRRAADVVHQGDLVCDRRVLVLPRFCPWQETVLTHPGMRDVLYVVFPAIGGGWSVQCVPPELGSFGQRKPLPAAWAGLRDAALVAATGVEDAVFCHPGRFIAGAGSQVGALRLAELAVTAE